MSAALKAGDELRCPHCGGWHGAFVKASETIHHQGMLFVNCKGGEYFVGRVGGRSRWSRRGKRGAQE